MNPSDLLNRIRESVPGLSWGFLTNSMIRALLTRESQHNFLVSRVMHTGFEGFEGFYLSDQVSILCTTPTVLFKTL
jgi:hypothetical protein